MFLAARIPDESIAGGGDFADRRGASLARADGTFDGGQVPPAFYPGEQVRDWFIPLNWGFDVPPVDFVDPLFFDNCGDGTVLFGGVAHNHPAVTFDNWTTYTLGAAGGTSFNLVPTGPFPTPTITVNASVSSTYGSDYFANGATIASTLSMGPGLQANSIFFAHLDTGTLRISGPMTGAGTLALSRIAAGSNNRGVYFDSPNGAYTGAVTIGAGTSARLLCLPGAAPDGRTGTGGITLTGGGELHILSDPGFIPPAPPPFTVDQFVTNAITSSSGTIRADHNYTAAAAPVYAPGFQHILGTAGAPLAAGGPAGSITVDNPAGPGAAASISFTADNGYNFGTYNIVLGNAAALAATGTRTVTVDNGSRREGYAGSVLRSGTNRLEEQVVTVQAGFGPAVPSLYDLDPVTLGGTTLVKTGTGVLSFNGDNTIPVFGAAASSGAKTVTGGVLRFMTATSYGDTVPGAPVVAPAVTLTAAGGPAVPVSAGMGVGYDPGAMPVNLITTGGPGIPGQAGAYEIDFLGYASAFVPARVPPMAPAGGTALRLGSSGAGSTTGAIGVYGATMTYYLGGGGGTLTIAAGPVLAAGGATVQMGTTGTLLPGRVVMGRAVATGGPVMLEAGTLQVPPGGPANLAGAAFTAVGSYSTTLGINGAYAGALGGAGGSFDGPAQLLLSAADAGALLYAYGPGGTFGAGPGLSLNGGAIGYDGAVGLGPLMAVLPAQYNAVAGAPMLSSLYTSIAAPGPAVATRILHLGGEYSFGVMTVPLGLPVIDLPGPDTFPGTLDDLPVALLKSGNGSALDLTANPIHSYSGGTAILGGEILVNMPGQLGSPTMLPPGAVVISDGGILHVVPGGPPVVAFPNILRVANGPDRRASIVEVDPGVVGSFSGANMEAGAVGSVLEKTGGGFLDILPGALAASSTPANTWGIKATAGVVTINQLPGIIAATNGAAVFDGGTLSLVVPPFAIAPARNFSAFNGFGGIETYAGTASSLFIADTVLFKTTGGQTTSLMGALDVTMGATSIFKIGQDAAGDDARGTGSINFSGGNVQFNAGGPDILFPHDGAFTMSLNAGAQFSGTLFADMSGNLLFNNLGAGTVTIDGATVGNGAVPGPGASIWTIDGTGLTSWNGTVIKGQTQAIPGGGGPFASGAVTINRCVGAPVSITAGALLDIEYGTLNAGGTGDPFTDTSTFVNLPVTNNATFNITAGFKNVASIIGAGVTTVSPGAFLDVGSLGPVTQGTFTVNGSADVGNVNVFGTTTVGAAPASLVASYIRGGALSVGSGDVMIKDNSFATGTSRLATVAIAAGGQLDLRDNKMIVTTTPIGTFVAGVYTDLTRMLQTGRNTGNWDGSGIITTRTDADIATPLTTLAIASASDVKGITGAQTALFSSQVVTPTDTLIMYTWSGDANLSGTVDVDDYFQINSNYASSGSVFGHFNGDFDYDGDIDADDYFYIDYGFSGQSFTYSTAPPVGVSAVPEPGGMVLIALSVASILTSRARRDHSSACVP